MKKTPETPQITAEPEKVAGCCAPPCSPVLNLYAGIGGNRHHWSGRDVVAVDLPRLVRLFPVPWSFDVFAHPAPKYSKATIYAADSTRIAQTFGADSEGLAQLIVTAVNQYLPNA